MTDNQQPEQHASNSAAAELGSKLRRAREQKGYSIGEVTERLKLSTHQIEGLESGNYEGLPELVFVRGFLRTYGRFLDLDDNEIAVFLDRIAPQNRNNLYAVERGGSQTLNYQQTEVKKSFPTWILGVLTAVVVGGGIYVWQNKSNQEYVKQSDNMERPELAGTTAGNLQAGNISVVAMGSGAAASSVSDSSASAPVSQDAASDVVPVAADELAVKVLYRSNLVIKDKNGGFVINRIVPAGSEHRFRGGAPYEVWIGYSIGATANYGGREINVRQHLTGKTTSSFTVGQQ
ncbi:helix-turn-helix domain-containing protein [Neisseria sp.]|uniref:helix-turn-helix domain-containing protein n=1 Tax=Neisseria sp. TaxID=192066 RepID=UPI0026DD6887|nr:helix-turn-helix domain-containing protein [Neisseria sp.]MDO4906892.1 helix-turn-helix domain-containing protein [Neisseria sp.]